jgi:hypothetical protein
MKMKLNCWIGLMLGGVALLGMAQGLRNRFIDTFDTVADMVANGAKGFPVVHVLGYYSPGDGGGGTFLLTNTVTGTNAGTRIYSARLGQSWERITKDTITVKDFGAKGDGTADDSTAIQAAATYAGTLATSAYPYKKRPRLFFPNGDFKTLSTVTVPTFVDVVMDGSMSYYGATNTPALVVGAAGQFNSRGEYKFRVNRIPNYATWADEDLD